MASSSVPQTVTIAPDNSDADSLASALFRDDLNSLAQLIIPSTLFGVLMDDGINEYAQTRLNDTPKELMVTFDANETVEVKYDGLQHTIVSSHDANFSAVPNGRAVDSVTIVKDKKNKKKKRFLKQREASLVTEIPITPPTTEKASIPKSKLQLPSFGMSRLTPPQTKSRKSKWSSSASLMSYAWKPRRSPQPQSDNASLTKIETVVGTSQDHEVAEPIRKQRTTKKNKDATNGSGGGDLASTKSNTLSSLLSFRKKQAKDEQDPHVRDYASLDYQPSPLRRRRLLQGKHRNVAPPMLEEEESPLAKTVSSTSITSNSSSPALPSIPVITHPSTMTTDTAPDNKINSSMSFFLPQWPAKLDDDDVDDVDDKNKKDEHGAAISSPNTNKTEEEAPSWGNISLFHSKEKPREQRQEPLETSEEEEEAHLLRHVIVVDDDQDEKLALDRNDGKNVNKSSRSAMAKPYHHQRSKASLTKRSTSIRREERLATVESFDSFYDGLVKQKKQEKEQPKPLLQQFVVTQEHEFDAFPEDPVKTTNEATMSLDRSGRLPERKRAQKTTNRFSFRPSGRFSRRNHQEVEHKAPVDSIEIPLLPKSDSAVACGTNASWNPSMLLCASGTSNLHHHHNHRHTSSNSVTSSLADDESLEFDDTDPRQLLQQPLAPAAVLFQHQHDIGNEEQETTDKVAGSTTRRSWFRPRLGQNTSTRSLRRGRSQPPVASSLEKPFPIVREDYSMNDGSYHVLKIGGPK